MICLICKNEFIKIGNQICCSKKCSTINKKEKHIIYRLNHKKVKEIYDNNYRQIHRIAINESHKKRFESDINFRIMCNLRSRLLSAIRGNPKLETTTKLVGCSIDKFKKHLEKQFKIGMNWNNWGRGWSGMGMKEWHIDHIIPCCQFDLTKKLEQKKCFHYTNLQPLWAIENMQKRKK
jgi:hypothetical protein